MPRITVVDDDDEVAILVQDILEAEGYNVVSYRDPDTALNEIEAKTPDLVILDIIMPKMNGVELLRRALNLVAGRVQATEAMLGQLCGMRFPPPPARF